MSEPPDKPNSVCIAHARGCLRAELDTATIYQYFEANGWDVKARLEKADLVLVFVCGVDRHAEETGAKLLSVADRKRKSGSRLVVLGCLAEISKQRLLEEFDAVLVPPAKLDLLDGVINAKVKLSDLPDANLLQPYLGRAKRCFSPVDRLRARCEVTGTFVNTVLTDLQNKLTDLSRRDDSDKAFKIRVGRGCLGRCSYCAVRLAAGLLCSKPSSQILAEFDAGLSQGYQRFDLIAGDLGAYGLDNGTTFVEFARSLFSREQAFRLHLWDFNPRWLVRYAAELTELFAANSRRIGCLSIPIQSGSESCLKHMQRGYTAAEARESLCQLQAAAPEIPVETHVIVGFPGETDHDFQETVRFLKTVRFRRVLVFKYSDRPGTQASRLPDKVPEGTKKKRASQLRRKLGGVCKLVS